MRLGRFEISLHNHGTFRLDGGAMFGTVPKNLWSRKVEVDQDNCVQLGTNSLLIRDDKRVFLVDTGMGDKWGEKERRIYDIRPTPESELGFERGEVTDIIMSHLHFDHSGGLTRYQDAQLKELDLCYPGARLFLQKANYDTASRPNLRERASYLKENVCAVGRMETCFLEGDSELHPGISVHESSGHTRGMQWVKIRQAEAVIAYPADLMPTSHHVPLPYVMGYDLNVERLLEEKQSFLEQAERENWIVVFEHDLNVPAARIGRDERGHFSVKEPVEI